MRVSIVDYKRTMFIKFHFKWFTRPPACFHYTNACVVIILKSSTHFEMENFSDYSLKHNWTGMFEQKFHHIILFLAKLTGFYESRISISKQCGCFIVIWCTSMTYKKATEFHFLFNIIIMDSIIENVKCEWNCNYRDTADAF